MNKTVDAAYWIEKLGMQKHPEGGYFVETYQSNEKIAHTHLPIRYTGDRSMSTSIYFLITENDFSSLHRIASDETWHFYAGDPLTVYAFEHNYYQEFAIGSNFEDGHTFQATVPFGMWFGSKISKPHIGYSLVGCTVAPGFHFDDFELGSREVLTEQFPQHSKLIQSLTRT